MDFPFIREAISSLFKKSSCDMYPIRPSEAAPNYRGRIVFHPDKCINCNMCERVCSGNAISHTSEPTEDGELITRTFYLGSCTFCATCMDFCGHGAIEFTRDYHMVATKEEDLMVTGQVLKKVPPKKAKPAAPAAPAAAAAPAAPAVQGREDGKPVQDPSKCVYCTICAKKCPGGALEVDRAAKTWKLDEDLCVACGNCESVCPKKAIVCGVSEAPAPAPKAAEPEEILPCKPAEKPATIGRDDGKPAQDPDKCVYCTLCAKNCPVGALEVDRAAKTWKLDEDSCVGCGTCEGVCPKDAIFFGIREVAKAEEKPAAPAPAPAPAAAPAPAEEPKAEEKPAEPPKPRDDGRPVQDPAKCVYCTLCAKKCPVGALEVDRAAKTWKLDEDLCIGCGTCAASCPKDAILY